MDYEEALRIYHAGVDMAHITEDDARAKWLLRSALSPLEQGEEMVKEALVMDTQVRLLKELRQKGLFRQVRDFGLDSHPFRSYVAKNIHVRLTEESKREQIEQLAVSQRCINIRKQLASMGNARRELASMRAKIQSLVEEPPPTKEVDVSGLSLFGPKDDKGAAHKEAAHKEAAKHKKDDKKEERSPSKDKEKDKEKDREKDKEKKTKRGAA